jgi:hypothetical protein
MVRMLYGRTYKILLKKHRLKKLTVSIDIILVLELLLRSAVLYAIFIEISLYSLWHLLSQISVLPEVEPESEISISPCAVTESFSNMKQCGVDRHPEAILNNEWLIIYISGRGNSMLLEGKFLKNLNLAGQSVENRKKLSFEI